MLPRPFSIYFLNVKPRQFTFLPPHSHLTACIQFYSICIQSSDPYAGSVQSSLYLLDAHYQFFFFLSRQLIPAHTSAHSSVQTSCLSPSACSFVPAYSASLNSPYCTSPLHLFGKHLSRSSNIPRPHSSYLSFLHAISRAHFGQLRHWQLPCLSHHSHQIFVLRRSSTSPRRFLSLRTGAVPPSATFFLPFVERPAAVPHPAGSFINTSSSSVLSPRIFVFLQCRPAWLTTCRRMSTVLPRFWLSQSRAIFRV